MREILTGRADPAKNEGLRVFADGDPGPGGAHYLYQVAVQQPGATEIGTTVRLAFQNGPVDKGVNGLTNEVLLAVVADRLECWQKGPCSCRENALALTKLQEALMWLHQRTRGRWARGVEGKAAP